VAGTLRAGAAGIDGVAPLVEVAAARDFAPGDGLAAGAAAPDHPADGWIDVPVPGDLHRALLAAGRIPDPFYDRHEDDVRWMEDREWWYRLSFEAPRPAAGDERLRLVFHGLDTYATAYLNGRELGSHRNMFREAAFDVTDRLEAGENVVAIRFDPPLAHAGPELEGQWAPNPHERVWMRKAQFGYGWDWGPRLPTVGLWRPVELRRERVAALAGVRFATLRLRPGEALVEVGVRAERFAGDAPLSAHVALSPPDGGAPVQAQAELEAGAAAVPLTVRDPALWWTHDLGDPQLHDLRVTLLAGGEAVAAHEARVGIRTIELDQRPRRTGTSSRPSKTSTARAPR
jgi:beta-mannosidase